MNIQVNRVVKTTPPRDVKDECWFGVVTALARDKKTATVTFYKDPNTIHTSASFNVSDLTQLNYSVGDKVYNKDTGSYAFSKIGVILNQPHLSSNVYVRYDDRFHSQQGCKSWSSSPNSLEFDMRVIKLKYFIGDTVTVEPSSVYSRKKPNGEFFTTGEIVAIHPDSYRSDDRIWYGVHFGENFPGHDCNGLYNTKTCIWLEQFEILTSKETKVKKKAVNKSKQSNQSNNVEGSEIILSRARIAIRRSETIKGHRITSKVKRIAIDSVTHKDGAISY